MCKRHKAPKPPNNVSRYAAGQKRCNLCEVYMVHDEIFCPCCGGRMRTHPRNRRYKEALRLSVPGGAG